VSGAQQPRRSGGLLSFQTQLESCLDQLAKTQPDYLKAIGVFKQRLEAIQAKFSASTPLTQEDVWMLRHMADHMSVLVPPLVSDRETAMNLAEAMKGRLVATILKVSQLLGADATPIVRHLNAAWLRMTGQNKFLATDGGRWTAEAMATWNMLEHLAATARLPQKSTQTDRADEVDKGEVTSETQDGTTDGQLEEIAAALATFHTLAVKSPAEETSVRPSAVNERLTTQLVCPCSTAHVLTQLSR
jgi:hypothetical protein